MRGSGRDGRPAGHRIGGGFVALILLILCSGLLETAALVVQHRVARQLATHVQPLELANAELRTQLADAQRGLRGYLLTADRAMLDVYLVARSAYPVTIQDLRDLATSRAERGAVDVQAARADTWWRAAEEQRRSAPRAADADAPLFESFVSASREFDAELATRAGSLRRGSAGLGVLSIAAVIGLTLAGVLVAVRTARRTPPPRGAEPDVDHLRREVRRLGYRIRAQATPADAIQEAIGGLHDILGADHVLVRMATGQDGVPPLASLRDEHVAGPLAALAARGFDWLGSGDVWTTDDPAPAGQVEPPDGERRAWQRVGDGPVLIVAVSGGDEPIGALTLIRDQGPPWNPVEVRLTEAVAAELGRGLHQTRLDEREHSLVSRMRELDSVQTDFMSTVSHELRTPLTSIAGYVELLLDAEAGQLTPTQTRMVEVVGRNTRRLRELIEDILILAKIESCGFRGDTGTVDLATLVDGAVTAVTPAASKRSVTLRSEVNGPLPLSADPAQIDRVLGNVLTNAVKFTPPEGTVTLTGRRDGDQVVLTVADTGMGIPRAEQDALFARFFRASNAVEQAVPGTGLGLAIVRTIIDNHGGRIDIDSTEQVGTTVTIRLPADRTRNATEAS
jgi:signal transduction histidine kinase